MHYNASRGNKIKESLTSSNFQAGSDSSPVSERPRTTVSDYCVPAAGADTRRQLRSSNRQLLAVQRYRLNTHGCRVFSVAGPQSGTLSRILSGTRPSVQTVSDVCLRRISLLDTSALSALEVL